MPLPHNGRATRPTRKMQLTLLVAAVLAVVLMSSGVAGAGSDLDSLAEVDQATDDMNSTAVEISGATYNADSNVLLTIDDEHNAYEFALTTDGAIDRLVTPRIIELSMGRDDFEGVAWIEGQTYAFLSEGSGEVLIATIPDVASNGTTTIREGDVQRSFPVISGSWGNLGPEGLATDGESFYVTREIPASLSMFDFEGNFEASVNLDGIDDASGVAILSDGTFLVISHESRLVAHYAVDWDLEEATLLASRSASEFTQLEGVAVAAATDLYLFGEDNTRKGQPGQTYSHLAGSLTAPAYSVSDVDCSGTLDIGDAMIIARMGVGIDQSFEGCGSGDHNGDGIVDLGDALLIAQCSVGISNSGCPSDGVN